MNDESNGECSSCFNCLLFIVYCLLFTVGTCLSTPLLLLLLFRITICFLSSVQFEAANKLPTLLFLPDIIAEVGVQIFVSSQYWLAHVLYLRTYL